MKRAPELRDLSDHHHQGLVQARRLRTAATGEETTTPTETAKAFLKFWQEETTAHFREEEEVLLPVLARYGGDAGRGPVAEMLAQHAQIRLEEREVFPMIEEVLPEEGLTEVASRLKVKEAGPRAEPWVPKDGLSYKPWPRPGDSEGGS